MELWHSFGGVITLCVVSADMPGLLSALYRSAITLENVVFEDDLTFRCTVQRRDFKRVRTILKKRDEQYRILGRSGLYWRITDLFKRPALVLGIGFLIALTVLLPRHILFFEVTGNNQVSDAQILEFADTVGLKFGVIRRSVRSEKIKNALLDAIKELEWVGINTSGCVATISVKERQIAEYEAETTGVSSIVAAVDGVVSELTTVKGTACVKPGQAVKSGQVLISGYTDCGLTIRAERAKGEVYATTKRQITLISPLNFSRRGTATKKTKKYSLILGKNRINFYQDSGNLDIGCVKIYEQKYMTLPGGFQLPVALITESTQYFEQEPAASVYTEPQEVFEELAKDYLLNRMIAGKILSQDISFAQDQKMILLLGEYECLEMIGRERIEEIIGP